jgi:hypothetical protein
MDEVIQVEVAVVWYYLSNQLIIFLLQLRNLSFAQFQIVNVFLFNGDESKLLCRNSVLTTPHSPEKLYFQLFRAVVFQDDNHQLP